jgi:hypothetical protein
MKSEEQLKAAARRLSNKTNVSYAQSLENLCIALYNRSWQEVKVTQPFESSEIVPSGQIHYLLEKDGKYWNGKTKEKSEWVSLNDAKAFFYLEKQEITKKGNWLPFRDSYMPSNQKEHHSYIRTTNRYADKGSLFWDGKKWVETLNPNCINPRPKPPKPSSIGDIDWEWVYSHPEYGQIQHQLIELEHHQRKYENSWDFEIQDPKESLWIAWGPFSVHLVAPDINPGVIQISVNERGGEETGEIASLQAQVSENLRYMKS